MSSGGANFLRSWSRFLLFIWGSVLLQCSQRECQMHELTVGVQLVAMWDHRTSIVRRCLYLCLPRCATSLLKVRVRLIPVQADTSRVC